MPRLIKFLLNTSYNALSKIAYSELNVFKFEALYDKNLIVSFV